MIPWFAIPAAILFVVGLYVGFFVAPTDAQQGDAYRIIFIHVPAAWMGMLLYVIMAIYAGIGWAFNARLSSMMATAIVHYRCDVHVSLACDWRFLGKANLGNMVGMGCAHDLHLNPPVPLHRIHLVAGVRLTIHVGADRAGAVLALVGVINVPIIYFSVQWWNTLHQGATIRMLDKPTIASNMLAAMLIMLAACWLYSVAVVLIRLRCIILEREQTAAQFAEAGV